jgi:protein-tyrosine phosphatase
MPAKCILFLCTGNYYRSRFAESLFNHLARQHNLPWTADSCGLRVQAPGVVNHGPLSPFAEAGLEMRSIPIDTPVRFPRQASEADFLQADVIIAIKELEHRPLMESLFPNHLPRTTFWHIHDLDAAPPLEALAALEQHVRDLLDRLAAPAHPLSGKTD